MASFALALKVMTFIDLIIVTLLLGTTQIGLRLGLIRQLGITAGLIFGLFAAAYMQWQFTQITPAADNTSPQHIYFWLLTATIILTIALFVDVGLSAAHWLHHKLEKMKRIELADRLSGAVLAGITTVVAVWLCSTLFLRTPNQFVTNQVRGSFIINTLKQTFPYAPDLFAQASNLLAPNGLPAVFAGAEPRVEAAMSAPDIPPYLQRVATQTAPSVVKVTGRGCGGISTGSGFVVAKDIVATNAHVIAGLPSPYIIDKQGEHPAETLLFDPKLDIAILRTSNLTGDPLPLNTSTAPNGTAGVSFGFASGSLLAGGAVVQNRQKATGYDIYDTKPATRTIYTISATIENGDSGGPITNEKGEVIGMTFAKSSTVPDVGYALTADQIADRLKTALADNVIIGNGQCGKE